MLEWGS